MPAPDSIASNIERLRNQVSDACAHARRDPATVALMAVSKTHPAEAILEAHAAGHRLFGENRVQEFAAKSPILAAFDLQPPPVVHLIGPLQNNKTAPAAAIFDAVDTIESLKTATRLDQAAKALGKTLPILIEVKLSSEEAKHGLSPKALPALLDAIAALSHLTVRGLMTVPPYTEDPALARPFFQQLRQLRDESLPAHPTLTGLSMGMSNDFMVAIEEGSTTVRLGTAIFGRRGHP